MSRISYRSHYALNYLKDLDTQKRAYSIDQSTLNEMPAFGSVLFLDNYLIRKNEAKIKALSQAYLSRIISHTDKLYEVSKQIQQGEYDSFKGKYILGEFLLLFEIKHRDTGNVIGATVFDKQGRYIAARHTNPTDSTDWIFQSKQDPRGVKFLEDSFLFAIIAFEHYAPIEVIESKARTKMHAQGCKYLNETDLDIEYLDSKWFTTLVNSKGFKVGGHFRLQPKKKDGEWVKELIWIEDFEKKGYNRKAGILK